MNTFAKRIREMRNRFGLSQAQLASRVNVKAQTVSLWERGLRCPSKPVITKLSEYLNVHVAYLMGQSDDDSPIREVLDVDRKLEVEADIEELAMIFSRLCQLSPTMRNIAASTISAAYKSDKSNNCLTPADQYDFSIRSTFTFMDDEEPIRNLQYPEEHDPRKNQN